MSASSETRTEPGRILLTGATGYVGGRLLPHFEALGLPVRCLARRPDYLERRVGAGTEIAKGDVLQPETLPPAFEGIDTAYYLVHSMGSKKGSGFESLDRDAAENFARAAHAAGVRRIVYLGGLGDESETLSKHLRSRHEVGRVLRESGVPVIELRASIVIGSGSLSFEMIRALVDRLPVMITPRWVSAIAQPIAIDDLLAYLEAALHLVASESRVYEIGGPERMSYGDLMREYAHQRGLRRLLIAVPVLTPRLSSLWLGLVTPLYARVGRILVESICHDTVVEDDRARRDFEIEPMGVAAAIAAALDDESRAAATTRWSDAVSSGGSETRLAGRFAGRGTRRRLTDSRECWLDLRPALALAPVRRIGGKSGWYAFDWLWQVRGLIDLWVGGVGLRRGRPDPEHLRVGDTIDWWRVETWDPDRLLRLRAEMIVPGRAWLEFEAVPEGSGSRLRQTATFEPSGALGWLYWFGIYPLHALVFRSMLAGIARAAVQDARGGLDAGGEGPDTNHHSNRSPGLHGPT